MQRGLLGITSGRELTQRSVGIADDKWPLPASNQALNKATGDLAYFLQIAAGKKAPDLFAPSTAPQCSMARNVVQEMSQFSEMRLSIPPSHQKMAAVPEQP